MDGSSITPVMPVGDNNMFGGNGFLGIFGLLILLGIFNGGFGGFGGGNQQYATRDQVQNGFDTQNLQAQTRDILSSVTNGTAQTIAASTANASNAINAIKDGNASLIREFGNVETALTAIGGKMQECCCSQLRAIDGVNYNTTVQIQKVLDALAANRMADMQSQINALQLQAATSNVLRFPNSWTFTGGVFPPVTAAAGA
ncbi:MAG: hypothetical protein IK140_02260 [Clostridia bacterium]|nr:hypothetical protein [Clostridia bacterium]